MQNCNIKLKTFLLDFLFPIHCVACGREKTHVCEACFAKIPFEEPAAPDNIFAASVHRENSPLAKLIHRFKYDGAKEIGPLLALAAEKIIKRNPLLWQNAVLVPVPLHWRRQNQRGFNQSEILAYAIGKTHVMKVQNILGRCRYTHPQMELDRASRLKNVVNAFSLKNSYALDPSHTYILVDDVATTGATFHECAEVLRKNGAKSVHGLVITRAV